ncbi:MAG: peptide-N4-asparagine amidase [Mycobacteriales bacterium]
MAVLRRRFVLALAVLLAGACLVAARPVAAATVSPPTLTSPAVSPPTITSPTATQQQVEANRPIPVPDTPSCTETVMTHDFASSYGAPYVGSYTPPAGCRGPWAAVVLSFSATVAGVQFDRDVYVAIGHALMLDSSTSEPCCTGSNAVTWTVSRAVSQYIPLLQTKQPVMVELDNVTNSTYTGVYHTVLRLTFYRTGPGVPAASHPDLVLPVSAQSPSSPMFTIGAAAEQPGALVTFPRTLVRLEAELFADAHGPCEEFWWSDPTNCAGTPYREVAVYIDGALAGAAPAYPVTYTGADGPGLWEPIPSPRAWNIRPYRVDLTPFVGELTDGAPHRVSLAVLGASLGPGDFWAVAANLLGWVRQGPVVTGALLHADAPSTPTNVARWDPSGLALYTYRSSHALSFSGYINTRRGRVFTRVSETMGETDTQTQLSVRSAWQWVQTVTTEAAGWSRTRTYRASYTLTNTALTHFAFTDNWSSELSVNGVSRSWQKVRESMGTSDATGIAYNGVEHERYGYADSSGACYDHRLAAQAGQLTVNYLDHACP